MFEPQIIYEDNHLLVVIKPANISVQADKSNDPDMLTLLKNYIKERDNKPGNVFLGLVHRLDRPTGGVMVFAKTSKCAARLSQAIRDGKVEKRYLCVVNNRPKDNFGKLISYLKKDEVNNIVHLAPQFEQGALRAELDYEVLQIFNDFSLVEVNLITGRPHQIRVQMSKVLKTPVYGDFKYGDKSNGANIGLWAYYLKINHPVTNKPMVFKVLPDCEQMPYKMFENKIKEKV